MIIDEFKQYCRDKGKYNITSLPEMLKLFDEFEKRRHGNNSNVEMPSESVSVRENEEPKEIDFSSLLNPIENREK